MASWAARPGSRIHTSRWPAGKEWYKAGQLSYSPKIQQVYTSWAASRRPEPPRKHPYSRLPPVNTLVPYEAKI